jgi:hypothetical protein
VPIGQLVKSLNGLTDDIILAAGENVTITPAGQTVTFAAPLTITAASDHGAVALQAEPVTLQDGSIGISGAIFAGNAVNPTRTTNYATHQIREAITTAYDSSIGSFLDLFGNINYTVPPTNFYFTGFNSSFQTDPTYTGDLAQLRGNAFGTFHFGTGAVTTLQGSDHFAANFGDGAVTDAFGAKFTYVNAAGGSITNGYGVYVDSPVWGNDSITNAYGIYVLEQSHGTNKWNIYSEGSTSRNYFEGDVTVDKIVTIGTSGYVFDPSSNDSYVNAQVDFRKPIQFTDTGTISLTNYTGTPRTLATILNDSTTFSGLKFETQTTDTPVIFWKATDGDANTLASLVGNKLYAQIGSFDKLSAGAALVAAGDYNLENYTGATYVCDCTAGAVTFTLPEIVPGVTLSGETYIFVKSDLYPNNVLISGAAGQTINGQASYLLDDQWKLVHIMAVVGPGVTPLTFWVVVGENSIVGPIGVSGFSGFSGRSGFSGYSGSGISGYSGSGISGYSGSGISGYSGYSGTSGYDGTSGYSGYSA